jgi:hypothetical protein
MRNQPAADPKPATISYKKDIVLPEMGKTTSGSPDVKSFIRNIFHLNPAFAIFCADVVISADPNSAEAKYLAKRYQIFSNEDIDMPVHPNVKVCTHIKVTGVRCGSPALRGEQFCYFHQRMLRGVQIPNNARLHPIALIENDEAIQASLMEVINALARNTIDFHRAQLILRALSIAVRNVRRARFGVSDNEIVREVPNYPAPPRPAPAVHEPAAAAESIELNAAPLTPLQTSAILALDSAPPDPTQRKPPARAGLPAEPAKAAAQARSAKGGS